MLGLTAWTIGAYSLAAHKEWRFIHPILPFLHIIAAFSIVQRFPGLPVSYIMRKLWWVIVPLLPIIAFVGLSYHATPIRVMYFLQSLPRSEVITGGIGLLMPCHSTPGQAYLHRQIADGKIWALGCEPPIG
jgi:phosphatidylinositol glycan class B